MDSTYVCDCIGSSPNVTVSPGISLKHFWQNVYRNWLGEMNDFALEIERGKEKTEMIALQFEVKSGGV